MRKLVLLFCFVLIYNSYSQEKKYSITGGFESNTQWFLNDKKLLNEFYQPVTQPEKPIRSNNYLFVNFKHKNWMAGIQAEGYKTEYESLKIYNPKYEDINVATYFLQYKNENIDVTGGYFYEQFGSGLLLRSWEDRSLGINNSLRGGRIIFKPVSFLIIKSLYGQQRTGFNVSKGKIYGADFELSLSEMFKKDNFDLSIGATYVGRDEKTTILNPKFNDLTNAYAGRISFSKNSFYLTSEYNYKTEDAVVQVKNQIDNNLIKPGSALLLNMGYSKKGFGIDGTFRRLENMSFYSERDAGGNSYNDMLLNYLPSLTKQHHYNLANIYVYQAQSNVLISNAEFVKAGEIGGQVDVFYNIKKGTKLGGKYGTKVALNLSQYHGLGGTFYIFSPQDYKTDFLAFGKKYFSDYNIDITKKWNDKWLTIFSYVNQYMNRKYVVDQYGEVNTNILAADVTYKFTSSKSMRVQAEHMWADFDKKNWASLLAELNIGTKYTFFVSDMYNYGNDDPQLKNHYYLVGNAFRHKSTRVSLSYGRQREGLVCVGGVCRFVPASTGFSLSLNTSF